MLEMRAIIIQVDGEEASVQPLSTGGCGHCNSEGGCGSGSLSKLFCSHKPRHFRVSNEVHAKVGDEVQVSIPDGVLLRGAMKMYVFPLILLLVGSIAGVGMAGESAGRDVYAATGAVIGLLLGFILARLAPGSAQAVASSIVSSRSAS
ncbi:MAG: SoxR reducing system RseC family protein [Gammaproteobacteria bacterium]|nr:SoxR reducing system RseC family protein [Gammaproteobacteria bacterium]